MVKRLLMFLKLLKSGLKNALQATAKYISSGDLIVGRLGVAPCRTIRTSVNLKYKRKPLLIYIVIKSFKCFTDLGEGGE